MTEPCCHHWLLASAAESTSGVCTRCGEERRFTGGMSDRISWTRGLGVRRARGITGVTGDKIALETPVHEGESPA